LWVRAGYDLFGTMHVLTHHFYCFIYNSIRLRCTYLRALEWTIISEIGVYVLLCPETFAKINFPLLVQCYKTIPFPTPGTRICLLLKSSNLLILSPPKKYWRMWIDSTGRYFPHVRFQIKWTLILIFYQKDLYTNNWT